MFSAPLMNGSIQGQSSQGLSSKNSKFGGADEMKQGKIHFGDMMMNG